MTEYTKLIERLGERYGVPDLSTDQLLKRRDRKRRNQRIAAGVVGIAVFVAAVWIVTSVGSLDRTTPAAPGGADTGPAVTGSVEPAPIGTVTLSGAGCGLEIVAEPIAPGAGTISVINETSRAVSFELFRFDPEFLPFTQFEQTVEGKSAGLALLKVAGHALLVQHVGVGPDASRRITDNFTRGDFAVVCLHDRNTKPPGGEPLGAPLGDKPFALVGPIVVP